MNQFSTLAFVPIFFFGGVGGKLEITQKSGCPPLPVRRVPGAPVPGLGGHLAPSKVTPPTPGSPCTPWGSPELTVQSLGPPGHRQPCHGHPEVPPPGESSPDVLSPDVQQWRLGQPG